MNESTVITDEVKAEIEELKRQRKLTLPVGFNGPEYARLTYKIQRLRHPIRDHTRLYAWRKENEARIKYERACKIAYHSNPNKRLLTEEQRLARNAAVRRHSADNPQRQIRQGIERTLLYFYNQCANGSLTHLHKPKVERLLGCKPQAFREHIRQQLAKKGWLWSDWRIKWTMDHVIPARRFNLPSQDCACWHYTNLRPLAKHLNHRGQRN